MDIDMDYCIRTDDEKTFDLLLLDTGLGVKTDDNVVPVSSEVLIDRIGAITMGEMHYPQYHANIRLLNEPDAEQDKMLAPFTINPSDPAYRAWA